MRIAVSYEDGNVFYHVGDTKEYKVYEIEQGTVTKTSFGKMNGTGRGAVVAFCTENHIDTLICGNICSGAKQAVKETGVEVIGCVEGNADKAVEAFLKHELNDNGTVECHHED